MKIKKECFFTCFYFGTFEKFENFVCPKTRNMRFLRFLFSGKLVLDIDSKKYRDFEIEIVYNFGPPFVQKSRG